MSELDFLQNEVSKSIEKLKEKVKSNKRKASWVNALSIILGAIITLTLGVDVSDENIQFQKNLALFFGAFLTITSGWNALFDYKKLWIRQKSTLLALYQIQNELGYRKSKNDQSQLDDIFEKYQDVWEKDSREWRNIFQSAKTANNDASKKGNRS
ncbi:hypothetical protein BZG20_11395 [Salinivibrio sp. IB868]|nr:hypothetical protein BZG20_11395 [Salinivibrio sp. IB868]OOE76711.1 hypothetical protein BZG22_03885 [Salinivibrio sp. IB870]